jgi:GTPase involved in cell partitioning and DNA repair
MKMYELAERMLKNYTDNIQPEDMESYEALMDELREINMDLQSKMEFSRDTLEYIIDNQIEEIDDDNMEEIVSDIAENSVYIYTSDLTEWLNRHEYNTYYLDEALQQEPEDGFKLLQYAQYMAITDIARAVIRALQKLDEKGE